MSLYDWIYKTLAGAVIILFFVINMIAVKELYQNNQILWLFGAILGVQILLTIVYHLRCLDCAGCMEQMGQGINYFYYIFASISSVSLLLLFLEALNIKLFGEPVIKLPVIELIVSVVYALLLTLGLSTAFKAMIGVRNIVAAEKVVATKKAFQQKTSTQTGDEEKAANTHKKDAPSEEKVEQWYREQEAFDAYQQEEDERKKKAQKRLQIEKEKRDRAWQRIRDRYNRRHEFHIPNPS